MQTSLSPVVSLSCGFGFILVVILSLYGLGFYGESDYFRWGPPVIFFDHTIHTEKAFYGLLGLTFCHQLVTNWVYEVVMPWIVNTIQNPANPRLDYSKRVCLVIVNANALYSQLHLALMVGGITSQISFLFTMIFADFLSLTYINNNYLKTKIYPRPDELVSSGSEAQMEEVQTTSPG